MADNTYQVGDLVPLTATFTDAAGVATNPTAVTLTVRAPDGTITTPSATNTSTGVYTANVTATLPGLYWYTFKGTGAVTAADRNSFYVEADWITASGPLAAHALVTLEDAREYVLDNVTDDTQDAKLVRRINAFSEAVWRYTRREWKTTTAATRVFRYPGYGLLSLAPYDLRTVTSIVTFTDYPTAYQQTLTALTTTDIGQYQLLPLGGTPEGTFRWVDVNRGYLTYPWTLIRDDGYWGYNVRFPGPYQVTITGDWGIATIPADVKEAVLLAIRDATLNPEGAAARQFGALTITEPIPDTSGGVRWRALPAESRALLAEYVDDPGPVVA